MERWHLLVYVTLRASVWIETFVERIMCKAEGVTLRASVWIETSSNFVAAIWSPVTLRASVWIETGLMLNIFILLTRHAPCERVD